MNCSVCDDEVLNEPKLLCCNNYIHMECIAKSGKSICCLCQRDVDIPEIYQHVLTNAIRLNEERKERDNLDAAIQIANENPPRLI